MDKVKKLGLFEGFGVEMEYMIVDRDTLQVKPIADEVLKAEAGEQTSDVERGPMAWSNELVLHVLELKTNGPAPTLDNLSQYFHGEVVRINQLLEPFNAMLLPTGAHPFMDPFTQTKLWPHDSSEIYEAYNQVFDCRGHGWSNLQSTHINLPFATDEEFGRLHAAIRLILPLIPALSAASPMLDGELSGLLDTRLEVYRKNQQRIPEIAGQVVPEAVFTQQEYQAKIFEPMFAAIAKHDPEGILQEEFLNSRGAIARFSRGAIEIRIIDNQECPKADIAIAALVTEILKKLEKEEWGSFEHQKKIPTQALADLFLNAIKTGPNTEIASGIYLQNFGLPAGKTSMKTVWEHLWAEVKNAPVFTQDLTEAIEILLQQGCLAQRMTTALGENPNPEKIRDVYQQLAHCLAKNQLFTA
ncbi:glutamate-cysteine ligase family protein [Rufibacter sp. LB8]|uniref:carboxylate-amine ligase n=1 Tax=Rufibacter sp. LB8 TaxID=2777781 RepID=UPI00178C6D7E|nr:glutamate-cysteine ligase family protein [Rufibacter sp. LB8]